MLRKAHLTSLSKVSGSRWVITSSWLSGSWRSFLYSSSVYSCHLFLISSASVRSIPFLSLIEPFFAWNVPLVSLIFLEISSLFHSVVFLYFFALIILTTFQKAFLQFFMWITNYLCWMVSLCDVSQIFMQCIIDVSTDLRTQNNEISTELLFVII